MDLPAGAPGEDARALELIPPGLVSARLEHEDGWLHGRGYTKLSHCRIGWSWCCCSLVIFVAQIKDVLRSSVQMYICLLDLDYQYAIKIGFVVQKSD